ncbi:hypothetical protein [Mediterraneibacter faecis]|uniref:hypothetical protein n=1 Tax=Mediterraneibacter faecis TaxID=592978 RepID=UPI0022E4C4FF|nr:hypothetical protein [Mediterraneibacter faecis]
MNLLNAPEQGIMYALYRDRVVYEPYKREQLEDNENLMKDLLELHLFDDTKEYRFIRKRKGDVEVCIDDSTVSHDDSYTEQIYTLADNAEMLDETSKKTLIEVVNYIIYDENDLMTIPNYRLKEVKA